MGTGATYSWIPSSARIVCVDGFGIVPRGGFPIIPQPLAWPPKDPIDVLDYIFDISAAIAGNFGDAIATLDVAITPDNPGDLVLQSSSSDGGQAILWLAGGYAGTTYAVTVTVGTNSGRVINRTVSLPVIALSVQPVPANAITDQTDTPIFTDTGAPLTVN